MLPEGIRQRTVPCLTRTGFLLQYSIDHMKKQKQKKEPVKRAVAQAARADIMKKFSFSLSVTILAKKRCNHHVFGVLFN